MPFVTIENVVHFSANHGVWLNRSSSELDAANLHRLVMLAWKHVDDPPLVDACCGGRGPLANYGEVDFSDYLELLRQIAIEESAKEAKKKHTKIRRVEYSSNRSQLLLMLIESGVPYICAHSDCDQHTDLAIDHVIPLSRGGSDEISNLQFLCRSHNSQKGDRTLSQVQD